MSQTRSAGLTVVLATDGSCQAHAALALAAAFPWADAVLVVGARGTGGLARLLLGSVAEGVLDRSPVPVLLVK